MTDQKEDYQYHGYCSARVEDQKKCVNYKATPTGICKYVLLGGACDFSREDIKKECL